MKQLVKISKVKGNPNNPRLIKDDKYNILLDSIKSFPQMMEKRPIIVDENMIVLGGNMRLKACKEAGLKKVWVDDLEDNEWTEDQKREFIIKDNVGFGVWDWEMLTDWDQNELEEWGMDMEGFDIDHEDYNDEFSLTDGDKEPFRQLTFTLADEQAEFILDAVKEAKSLDEHKYIETFGNENGNGNALYLLISQWVEQKK